MKFESLFISDIHLGSPYSNVEALINFLKDNKFKKIYLCGDIFDFLVINKNFFWSNTFNLFIQKILKISNKGTKIYYIAGNHDALIRKLHGYKFGNIKITNSAYYKTINNKKIKITHGDEYDYHIKNKNIVYFLGTIGYSILLGLNGIFKLFFKDFSLSFYVKRKIKKSFEVITKYRQLLLNTVEEENINGIISGHTHFAELNIENGKLIGNCGCWMADTVNNAIVECKDGTFKLLTIDNKGKIKNEKILTCD